MINSILVPLDGSENASRALDFAADLAGKYDGEVILLYVMSGGRTPDELKRFAEVEHIKEADLPRELAERVLESGALQAERHGLKKTSRQVRDGDPATEILEAAKAAKVDAIVMGTRGLGALKGLLLGSVSHKVTQLAECTCATVR